MTETRKAVETPLTALLPPEWLRTPEAQVWLTVYAAVGLSERDFDRTWSLDLNDLRVLLLWGALPYYDTSGSKFELGANQIVTFQPGGTVKQSPIGAWLALFGEYLVTPQGSNESDIKRRIAATKGLLMAILGRNVAHHQLCENIIVPAKGQWSGFSPIVANPYVFPSPRVGATTIALTRQAHDTLTGMQVEQRNRFDLSLHWYEASLADDGVDAFIKAWIALETLAMPDTTNIAPVKELLGQAYSLSASRASADFFLGWLYSIRGRIVHDGTLRSLYYAIPMYLEAVYKDVLFAALGLPCEQFAAAMKRRGDLNIQALLKACI